MKRDTAKLLLDAEHACQEIQGFSEGLTKQEISESRILNNLAFTKLTDTEFGYLLGEWVHSSGPGSPLLTHRFVD